MQAAYAATRVTSWLNMQETPAGAQHEHKSIFRKYRDGHNCNIQALHPKI